MAARVPTFTEIEYEYAHRNDDRGREIVASAVVTFILATIAIILRLVARRISKAILQADDWTILVAWLVALAQTILNLLAVPLGAGKHVIFLKDITSYAKIVLFSEIFYVMGAALVKCAILLLYRRLFGSIRRFQHMLWAVGAFVIAYSLAELLVIIFQCRPTQAAWNISVDPNYCVNLPLGGIIVGAINATTDFVVLLLPIPMVLRLEMKTKWKIQLIGIFLLGGFVCVGSIYRVAILHKLSFIDATWNDVDPAIWAMVENCIGIVSACLPTLRPIFNLIARGHHCSARSGSCSRCANKSRNRSSYAWDFSNAPDLKKPGHASWVGPPAVQEQNAEPSSDLENLRPHDKSEIATEQKEVPLSDFVSLRRPNPDIEIIE